MNAKAPNTVEVSELPPCDLKHLNAFGPCDQVAWADAKLSREFGGIWGNVCKPHFDRCGCKLGEGTGQRLIKVVR